LYEGDDGCSTFDRAGFAGHDAGFAWTALKGKRISNAQLLSMLIRLFSESTFYFIFETPSPMGWRPSHQMRL